MNRLRIALTLLVTASIGCTETVYIRTTPPGARLSVNNREIGVTPVEFDAPSRDMAAARFPYRMELAGYRTAEGTLTSRVSVGRVIGSIVTLGIFAATRGVRVFAEDEIHQTLYPLDVATSSANGVQIGIPHKRKVFFTTAPLDSLPPNSYVLIKELATEFKWVMAGAVLCLEEMAEDARKLGADAVFNVYTRQRFAFGGSPIRPTATGMAVALRDPCATKGISGEYRPADEADTPQNRAVSARCQDDDTVRSNGAMPRTTSGKCSVEQVLTMKASGLSDDQVKAACGR